MFFLSSLWPAASAASTASTAAEMASPAVAPIPAEEAGYMAQLLAWDPVTPWDVMSNVGVKAAEALPETAEAAGDVAKAAADAAFYGAVTTAVGVGAVGTAGYIAYRNGVFKSISKMF